MALRTQPHRDHVRQLRKYGLTPVDYAALLAAQGGVCALCGSTQGRRLVVDHCHETGRVRGLLCTACNGALGKLGDTPEALLRVVAYLRGEMPVPMIRGNTETEADLRVLDSEAKSVHSLG